MPEATDIFVAKTSATINVDGQSYEIRAGVTRVRAGHPLLKGREMYFEPMTIHYDVEQATARPGEKRGAPKVEPVVTASEPVEPVVAPEPEKAGK